MNDGWLCTVTLRPIIDLKGQAKARHYIEFEVSLRISSVYNNKTYVVTLAK